MKSALVETLKFKSEKLKTRDENSLGGGQSKGESGFLRASRVSSEAKRFSKCLKMRRIWWKMPSNLILKSARWKTKRFERASSGSFSCRRPILLILANFFETWGQAYESGAAWRGRPGKSRSGRRAG